MQWCSSSIAQQRAKHTKHVWHVPSNRVDAFRSECEMSANSLDHIVAPCLSALISCNCNGAYRVNGTAPAQGGLVRSGMCSTLLGKSSSRGLP